jgi:hypothetical protein
MWMRKNEQEKKLLIRNQKIEVLAGEEERVDLRDYFLYSPGLEEDEY